MRDEIAVTCKIPHEQDGSEETHLTLEEAADKRSINGAGMFGEGLVAGVTIYGGPATSNVQASTGGGVRKGCDIVTTRWSLPQCRLSAFVGYFCCHVSNRKSATVLAECMASRAMRASIRLNPRSRPWASPTCVRRAPMPSIVVASPLKTFRTSSTSSCAKSERSGEIPSGSRTAL
jgi:hypothetical protein